MLDRTINILKSIRAKVSTAVPFARDVRMVIPAIQPPGGMDSRAGFVHVAVIMLLASLIIPGGLFIPQTCRAGLAQTITFAPLADRTYGDPDFAPGATASSGLAVSYASSDPAVAAIVGETIFIVGAGTTNITASQTGDATYDPATDVVQPLTVNKADPTVTGWPTASAIIYGETLTSSILTGGSASMAGNFAFTTPTTAPDAGTAVQSVTFTPTDTTNYNTVTGSVDVTVAKADPSVTTWPTASAITYGETLTSSTLTGGSASVTGTFDFTTPTTAPNTGTAAQSVTFTPTDTINYNTVTGSVDVTVSKAAPTVTIWPVASAVTYGQTLASSILSGGTASVAGTFDFTTPTTAPNAGTAAQSVTFTPSDTANYNIVTGSVDVTVSKADPTVTTWPTADAITYGQTLASSTLSGGSASEAGTFAFTTSTTSPNAGTAAQSVTFTPIDTANYNTVTGSVDVTVAKADPTVSTWPTAGAITFGQTLASSILTGGTASVAGSFAFTMPIASPDAGTAAQSVTFTPSDTTNYNTVIGSVDVTVTKADPTVTAWPTATPITYGQMLASSSFTGGSASTAGTFAFTNPATAPDAGTAAQSVTFTPSDTTNYNFVAGPVSVTVSPATLTVTADSLSKNYGSANPALTVSYSGFVNGDTAASLGNQPTAGTTATIGSPVGTYPITASGGESGNYSFTYIAGSLTVNPASLIVTADNHSKTYGAANPVLTISYSGFVNGDTSASLTTQPTVDTTATTSSPVGTYPITVSGGAGSNYSFTYVAGTLTVDPAILTVSADNQSRAYDTENPSLTVSYSGFVNGDTSASLTTQPAAVTSAVTDSPVGTYPITVSGGTSSNYSLTYVAGTLTVTTGDPVVTVWPMASTITYGDTLASSTLSGGSASVPGSFTFTSPATPPDAGTAAQSVTFTPADTTNYNTVADSINVTVAKADPIITTWPAASAITYGQTLAVSTLTGGTASVAGSFAFTTPGTAPNAGTVAHDATFTPTDTANYNPVNGSVSVLVNAAILTVMADDQTKTYGAANPPLTFSYSGFVSGETAGSLTTQPTAGTTATIDSPAGTYPITVSGGVSSNYQFNYVAGTLTITAPTITVTAFTMPETATILEVPVITFTATDAAGVAGYLITETATVPSAGDAGWTPTAPTSFIFGGYGSRTAYAWAKDAIGNVSASLSATVTINDVIPPVVTAFVLPATSTSLTVAVGSFTATDNFEVTGYLITESATAPDPGDAGWSGSAPGSFTFGGYGTRTAYAWVKDAAGNVSASLNTTVLITGSASTLTVSGIASPRTAGTAGTVTVTAKDANGYTATTYRGTVRFASSDLQAVLPSEYTFTAADNGVHTFDLAVTLKTAGPQFVTATDIDVPLITGMQEGITVEPAQAHSLAITGIASPVTAGTASTVTVTARDQFGNIATGYTGTVRFSGTDPQAVLPADFTFSAGNNGVKVFNSQVTLRAAGIKSVTVTDINASNLTATLSGITVNPGAAATLAITGIASPRPADVPSTITVTLTDAHGNIASGYRGTVRFTSTDPQAILPSIYTFGAGDAGSHSFQFMVTLKTPGIQTVTATDVADPGIAGSQTGIDVTPGVAALQAAQAAAGFSHTAVLDTEGRVWTWGKNDAGQLGTGTTVDTASPAQVIGISGVVAIAAGYEHTVALKNDGTVWTWGSNEYGQLGDGSNTDRLIPVQVPGVGGIAAIAAGSYHTVALKSDSTVVGWGRNAYGQLGDRTKTNRTQPVQAYGMTGVAALAAGGNHTLLLTNNGEVWTMGANGSGQLGNGSFGDSDIPVRVQGLVGAKVLAAGMLHSIAIGNDGTAWVWGDNGSGQLGEGSNPNSPCPVRVAALSDVVDIAGGGYHTIALKDDGTLWSWGRNDNGQLGDGTTAGSAVPKQLQEMTGVTGIVALAAGGRHNAVVMGNGTVWTWGDNAVGQLGDGSTSYKEHFVPVGDFSAISTIEGGGNHTVVLKTDGTVWTWGKNAFGQLGNGTLANSSLPGQVTGLTGIVAVAAGASHTAALKNDGTVWAWGLNESGQLGDGTVTPRPLPVQVQGLSDVTAIAAGSYFTLALKDDGTVWGWGSNTSGQLGDDTTISKPMPVRVGDLTGVSAIAAGYLHALALKNDGTVWAWGFNRFGQLGDATNILRKAPVQAGIANAVAVAAGSNHSLALQSGGTIWAWGLNGYGQLGDGTNSDRNVPVEVTTMQGATAIAAGSNHSIALLWDRSVWLWGDNFYGQLGNGSGENENLPQQLHEFFDIGTIAAGGENSLLVKNDGSLWTVGDNDSGQLGSGTPYIPAVVPGLLLGNDDVPPVTTASLAEGTYNGTQTIVLSSSEPGVIYYTLDGTTPTTGSVQYGSPISIPSSTVLKFFALDRAGNMEAVKTRNYVVNPHYPLNLYLQGGGSGRIDLSSGGSCVGTCSQSFLTGTTVDLTPVPLADSVFMGWSGCDSVIGQVCMVTVTSARNVTANFDPAYTLFLSFVESGTVSFSTGGSCTGACAKVFRSGTTVELSAAGNGTVFEGWSGCDTTSGYSCTVSMNGSRSVTASYGYLVWASSGKGISIQAAYDRVAASEVVWVRAAEVTENVNLNRPVTIRLAGGYNSSFTDVIGMSTLHGTFTIAAGMVIVDRLVIR